MSEEKKARFEELKAEMRELGSYMKLSKDKKHEYSLLKAELEGGNGNDVQYPEIKTDTKTRKAPPVVNMVQVNDSISVGDKVEHRVCHDRFTVEEVRVDGFFGRKINNKDPLRFYAPSEVFKVVSS